ncbi:substrate-binding domain-containing protein [Burkholderia pseudomultivorans]|uniref:substrate-binding domain-containing protein n=1 Tax=Burkholderia pseudomultivorans TaxID=1207504 RepID=UPI0038575A2B
MRLVAHPGTLAPKVSAIIAGSSHVTIGIPSALKELDVDVPGTLSLVGFGDPTWARWRGPGLTKAHLPIHELATTCGLWLLRSLANKGTALPALQSIAKSELIVRGSTAPIAPTS